MRTTRHGRATGGLPTDVTSFVGRRRELSDVRTRLSESRLVTLTGVGGVGKTRLAVEVARGAQRTLDAGVTLVDFAAVEDGARVPQAVADALDLVGRAARSPTDLVVDHLGDGRALVVLDNCEHVHGACAQFVNELLGRVPGVRVMVTSRRSLGIAGEHLYGVPPLAFPDPAQVPTADELLRYDAVRLLTDRAGALLPDFTITDGNRLAAARVCAELDGIPLAIELAAARLRTLSLQELADRLPERFALLTTGSPVARPRQQTLRGLIDWSHRLCTDDEQLLWARLSVFVGTFDLAAAEAVCTGEGLAGTDVLDLLDRLVAQSIVLVEPGDGPARFRLTETIREYGRERLAELGETGRLRRRHLEAYHARVQDTDDTWSGPHQADRLAQLRADQANLRAALDLAMSEPPDTPAALSLAYALRSHWSVGGFLAEGRAWLDRALDLPDQPPQQRVEALWVAACLALPQGDFEAAARRLAECDELAARLGNRVVAARSTSLSGSAALATGDLPGAVRRFEEAIATFEAVGGIEDQLLATFQLVMALCHGGDGERARAVGRAALATCEARGERLSRSYVLWALGFTEWRYGDVAAAAGLARDAVAIQREFHNPVGVALMTELLAWIEASRNDAARAARLLGAAGSVWDGVGTTITAFGPDLGGHHARCEERIRQELGKAADAALRQGRQPTVADVIAVALDRRPGAGRPENGGRDPRAPRATADGRLTRRERQVAELVARGLSNRAIAATLIISPRTVDGHLEQILAKLGFESRTQVAAWVSTHT